MQKHLLKAYLKVWLKLTTQQFQTQVANARTAALLFILGKLFRLGTALLLVYVIVGKAKLIAGYNLNQAVFLLLLFNLTSTVSQLFLRGVYMFRQKVQDGSFDFYLLNPLSELFYSLFSNTDPLDLLLVLPYVALTTWAWIQTGYPLTIVAAFIVCLIILVTMMMVTAWHIVIIAIGVKYLEVDNTIMLYRDLERMGGFPVTIYGKLTETILTYAFPFALMATIPANLIFGLFNPWYLGGFALLAVAQLKISLWLWHRALKSYGSASS